MFVFVLYSKDRRQKPGQRSTNKVQERTKKKSAGANVLQNLQIGFGAHSASYSKGNGVIFGGKAAVGGGELG
jgi:hypothetical protein